ncbi:MAG: hypothetical protein Q9227_009100 [Pyrenula ochraceoflavens]
MFEIRRYCSNFVKKFLSLSTKLGFEGICEYNFHRPVAQSADELLSLPVSPIPNKSGTPCNEEASNDYRDETLSSAASTPESPCTAQSMSTALTTPVDHGTDAAYFTPNTTLDLLLMHHYTSSTWKTLSDYQEFSNLWQCVVPQEALSHVFLLHGLLALSALHLAYGDNVAKRSMYIESAVRHQDAAVTLFRRELSNINRSNCSALFAFSSLIAVFAFEFARVPGKDGTTSPGEQKSAVDEIFEIIVLLRGIQAVLDTAKEWLLEGTMGLLLQSRQKQIDRIERLSPGPEEDVACAIDRLLARNETEAVFGTEGSKHRVTYQIVLHSLRLAFARAKMEPRDRGMCLIWPVTVDTEYAQLLKSKQPMALLILAHYAVMLHKIDESWWGNGWGRMVVEDVSKTLDQDWRDLLSWPLEKVGLGAAR